MKRLCNAVIFSTYLFWPTIDRGAICIVRIEIYLSRRLALSLASVGSTHLQRTSRIKFASHPMAFLVATLAIAHLCSARSENNCAKFAHSLG